jgi:hypothetical protein
MRVIIAGNRSIRDDAMVRSAIEASGFLISEIVSGGSNGVDESAERIAERDGIPLVRFPADWDKYGKKAGPIRNREMADYADALIAVWDGKSRGTLHMIETMRKAGKPVYTLIV